MKKWFIALLLLCLPVFTVSAAEHTLSQPELLEQVQIPEHWAEPALRFCVGNGILMGKGDSLGEEDPATRAETAAILVRLLGAQGQKGDLSHFKDVKKSEWYYEELSAAVKIGILKGTGEATAEPNTSVTREQVFAMLCRAFGLQPSDPDLWQDFTDAGRISPYARNAVSALVERGVLNGYPDGTVLPGARITRSELAMLLYQLFTAIADDPADLPSEGRVLYRGAEPIPEGYALEGDLTVGCGIRDDLALADISVTGELRLACEAQLQIDLTGVKADSICLAVPAKLTADTAVDTVFCSGEGSELDVQAERIVAAAGCRILNDVQNLSCLGSGTVTLEGHAETVRLYAPVKLTGSGSAELIRLHASGCQVEIPYERQEDHSYEYDYANALSTVQTVYIWDTVTKDTKLYSSSGLYGVIRSLPEGTKLEHYYLQDGASAAGVITEDGVFGYVPVSHIRIPETLDLLDRPYSQGTMEGFVNGKGYSGSTGYLIWVSLKTQTVNIFTGSKGNWKLLRSAPCASGKPATPTVRGSFRVQYHYNQWNFDTYKVRYVTGFYEGYAFHSRCYSPDWSVLTDPTIGEPASHGCLRMLDEDCRFIYESIPYGTPVIVY